MCGINMILRKDGSPAEREDITRMCSVISHRGPDGAGYALLDSGSTCLRPCPPEHHRPPGGRPAVDNEDGAICINFNGEIYDYKQLRE